MSGQPAALQEGGFLKVFFKLLSLLAPMDSVLDFPQDEGRQSRVPGSPRVLSLKFLVLRHSAARTSTQVPLEAGLHSGLADTST